LRDWQEEAGVWEEVHRVQLDRLGEAEEIDWERASFWTQRAWRPKGGPKRTGANPTDKGKSGSKRHVVADRGGIPLAVILTAANVHDSKVLEEAVDSIRADQAARGRSGRPRKRPKKLHADKGYDFPRCRKALRKRGITPASADAGSTRARDWDGIDGWWSVRWRGWAGTAGWRCAMSGGRTSTKRSSILGVS
jgi:IS5 family transposase